MYVIDPSADLHIVLSKAAPSIKSLLDYNHYLRTGGGSKNALFRNKGHVRDGRIEIYICNPLELGSYSLSGQILIIAVSFCFQALSLKKVLVNSGQVQEKQTYETTKTLQQKMTKLFSIKAEKCRSRSSFLCPTKVFVVSFNYYNKIFKPL